jgi:hypothetical protein
MSAEASITGSLCCSAAGFGASRFAGSATAGEPIASNAPSPNPMARIASSIHLGDLYANVLSKWFR